MEELHSMSDSGDMRRSDLIQTGVRCRYFARVQIQASVHLTCSVFGLWASISIGALSGTGTHFFLQPNKLIVSDLYIYNEVLALTVHFTSTNENYLTK